MSAAILRLSESGELQKIQKKWYCGTGCSTQGSHETESNQIDLSSLWGLFLLFGISTLIAVLVFFLRTGCQCAIHKQTQTDPSSSSSSSKPSSTHYSQVMRNFFDSMNAKGDAIKKMFKHSDNPKDQASCPTA
ncbi:hypothetical protein L1049_009560 [Liquidambar formosana]|uniref:Uncharacterized protein n=1 Tax=Liquidambar formosana TaxID=63359 RepID=A0AAP0N884_LIQFO